MVRITLLALALIAAPVAQAHEGWHGGWGGGGWHECHGEGWHEGWRGGGWGGGFVVPVPAPAPYYGTCWLHWSPYFRRRVRICE